MSLWGRRKYSPRHELEIVLLYTEEGYSTYDIEKLTGVKYGTVRDILCRHGVKMRTRAEVGHRLPSIPENELVRTVWLHQQGLTYAQIGELLGLAEGGVQYRIEVSRRRLGYQGNNRGANNKPKATIPVYVRRAVEAWA